MQIVSACNRLFLPRSKMRCGLTTGVRLTSMQLWACERAVFGSDSSMIHSRADVTRQILVKKLALGLRWGDVAAVLGRSAEWSTAACLGQMALAEEQANKLVALLDLDVECAQWLQAAPSRGALSVPADPCLYRFHEALSVYGPAIKELIHEEFGDGIMSAIDFKIHMERKQDPDGDRVQIVWDGKFLPYKQF